MSDRQQFPYVAVRNAHGEVGLRPMLPLTLRYNDVEQEAIGLLDSGADVNVLPYGLGLALGCIWGEQPTAIQLSGNLANHEARGILLEAAIADFPIVTLAFAWTRAEDVPLILGQINFFMEFNVCFYRSHSIFEIQQRGDA